MPKKVMLGAAIIRKDRNTWFVMCGRDPLHIPFSKCEVKHTKDGDRYLEVDEEWLMKRKGVKKGVFYNYGSPDDE